MATKKWYLLEHLSSEGSLLIHEGLVTLILWGLLYVLLLTVLSFGFNVQPGDLSDNQDVSAFEAILFYLGTGSILRRYSPSLVAPGLFILLIFNEYLRGHIGEKRPEASNPHLKSSRLRAQKTALSSRAVFCMFQVALFCLPKAGVPLHYGQRNPID